MNLVYEKNKILQSIRRLTFEPIEIGGGNGLKKRRLADQLQLVGMFLWSGNEICILLSRLFIKLLKVCCNFHISRTPYTLSHIFDVLLNTHITTPSHQITTIICILKIKQIVHNQNTFSVMCCERMCCNYLKVCGMLCVLHVEYSKFSDIKFS